MVKLMFAKYRGTCAHCSGAFEAGARIAYDTDSRSATHHPDCPAEPEAFVRIDAAPYRAELRAATVREHTACAAFAAARDAFNRGLHWVNVERGMCTGCAGTGRVVTWSTMDGPSYTEYGPCPACRGATFAKSTETDFPFAAALLRARAMEAEAATARVRELRELLAVKRGAGVVVARGRKIPKGTTGVVIWLGEGRFGTRVGVKDSADVVHWTAASNCDVTHVEVLAPRAKEAA